MTLPGSERALIDIGKLHGYCLNLAHPRGRHKARVFVASLGLSQAEAAILREYLAIAAVQTRRNSVNPTSSVTGT